MKQPKIITMAQAIEQWHAFDVLLDARTPAEYAQDHLPGAANAPVLSDQERIDIGTLYKQESGFEAKKRGAALTARNIADYIERECLDKPRDWRPLVYCWRGGNRSGSLAIILAQIGFPVAQLEGGYKAFRSQVMEDLKSLSDPFEFIVLCGTTGSGKSRVLETLAQLGEQTLDLEALAHHRGSVLGPIPDLPQPGQKQFETRLWSALRGLDPARPVYVECESKKVGNVRVPDELMNNIRQGQCIVVDSPIEQRIALLRRDYPYWERHVSQLGERMEALVAALGREMIAALMDQARLGQWDDLVRTLLEKHYDPAYLKSIERNFRFYPQAQRQVLDGIDAPALLTCAQQIRMTARGRS